MAYNRPEPQVHHWWVPGPVRYPSLHAVATGLFSFWPSFLCNIGVQLKGRNRTEISARLLPCNLIQTGVPRLQNHSFSMRHNKAEWGQLPISGLQNSGSSGQSILASDSKTPSSSGRFDPRSGNHQPCCKSAMSGWVASES